MKIMLTGGKGMLGRTICQTIGNEFEIIPTDLPEVDITSLGSLQNAVDNNAPDVIIHCAAMTAVDKCESECDLSYKLNSLGSNNVARICDKNNIRLIAISTDYVFKGDSNRAYNEFDIAGDCETIYGKSKFAGEELIRQQCANHIIARISWLYGFGGPSFVHAMKNLSEKKLQVLKVVNDQIGNPTSAIAVAMGLKNIINYPAMRGTVHLTCEGEASWYDFAVEIFKQLNITQKVEPCTSAEFVRPAPRPKNSRLDKMVLRLHKLPPMPNWKDALKEFVDKEF